MFENEKTVPKQTVKRLPDYLTYLRGKAEEGVMTISAPIVAKGLNLNEVQVRKDLAAVSECGGKPRTGYLLRDLILDIEKYLGYDNVKDAIIVGVGHLGSALISFEGFKNHGLNVVAGFDTNEKLIGTEVHGKRIFPINRISEICKSFNVKIGIITVPDKHAQEICDIMVKAGVLAIWNFAQVHLNVPDDIIVQNENLSASIALLSKSIKRRH